MSEVLGPVTAAPEPEQAPLPEPAVDASAAPALLEVRATVNLPKLATGRTALVDPSSPYIAGCLARGTLVPVEKSPAVSDE